MSAADVVVLIAAIVSVVVVVGLLVAVGSLQRQVRQLARVVDDLRHQTVPLVAEAHRVVDQAANELERVGSVLESTESVHSTVDSASKLAYRAFANPVVKVLAIRAGAAGGVRRLRARPVAPHRPAAPGRATHQSRAASRRGR
jgi:predicted PurR-regulated permease PerM